MGFMGAGKTTVGRLLAPMLGWQFLDTDEMLVKQRGASIAAIFKKHGEPKFREWEAEVVASALREEQVVIALGGGAVEHPRTRELLSGDVETLTVYLEVPLALAIARCRLDTLAEGRPVLADAFGLEQRYDQRLCLYGASRFVVLTKDRTPMEIAESAALNVNCKA